MSRLKAVVSATLLFFSATLYAQTYSVSHFAGTTGGQGYQDGSGSAARFTYPNAIAVDRNGSVYVGETDVLRRVTASGNVTTLAGKFRSPGVVSLAQGGSARVSDITGIAIDSLGNIFIAEAGGACVVRKVSPSGFVTAFAGTAASCSTADGVGSAARFYYPRGLAIDSADNLYVTQDDHVIRKITPAGSVTTIAGSPGNAGSTDGTGPSARFQYPHGIVVDSTGNLFVNDSYNFTIRRITPGGVVSTFAGTAGIYGSADGTGATAQFRYPWGLTIDPTDTLWETDFYGVVRRITPNAVVTTVAGSPQQEGYLDGDGTAARFKNPLAIATDGGGNLFVVDNGNGAIRKVSATFDVSTLAGLPAQKGYLDGPGSAARFLYPRDVVVDAAGNAYVTDSDANAVRKITPAGVVTTFAGGTQGGLDGIGTAAQFNYPVGIAIDAGNLYVADGNGRTVRKITIAGADVTTLAGTYNSSGNADGTGSSARFNFPHSLTVDAAGNVYVTEYYVHTIRKITPAGVVTTLAGSFGSCGSADGTGSGGTFCNPRGIVVGPGGNLFVADYGKHTIRQVTPAGVVTTYAGLAGSAGNGDGTGSGARLFSPLSLTADGGGNLYVTTGGNNLIRKIAAGGVVTTIVGPGINNVQSIDGTGTDARILGMDGITSTPTGNFYVVGRDDAAVRIMRPVVADTATASSPAATNSPVTLSTTGGGANSWSWSLLRRPTGSIANLSSTSTQTSFFTPDVADLYTFLVKADGPGGTRYSTVDVTPTGSCTTPLSPAVTVSLSGTSFFCASSTGGTAFLTGSTGGQEVTYKWGYRTTSGTPPIIDIPGANQSSYVVRGSDLGGVAGTRYLVLTVVPACGINRVSNEIVLTLDGAPSTTITTASTVQGRATGIAASIPSAGAGAVYNWTISGGVITSGASTASILYTAGNSSPVTLSVTASLPSGCSSSTSRIIAVNEVPYTFSHLAGTLGGNGAVDGAGTNARFAYLTGVAVDKEGSIYLPDGTSVRKLTTSGRVATLAGLSESSFTFVNATGSAARFGLTGGVTLDAAGNLYVMDGFRLRKITPGGAVTTIAGSSQGYLDGTGAGAQFNSYGPVVIDSTGNLFVLDTSTIRKVTPAGVVTTFAGSFNVNSYVDGAGTAARFNVPQGIAIDAADNIYVADSYNHVIRRITPAGAVTTYAGVAGSGDTKDGPAGVARLLYPWRLTVDSAGNVYVGQYYYNVRKITPAGFISTIAGSKVFEYDFVDGTGSAARFGVVGAMATDPGGNVVLIDNSATVRRVTPAGVVTTIAGSLAAFGSADGTGAAALMRNPAGVALAADGSLYVSDSDNYTIRRVTTAGVVTTVAGSPRSYGAVDGNGSAARFSNVGGLAFDPAGNLYVCDVNNHTIRRITPTGDVTTIAGQTGSSGSTDGTGSAARFYYPQAIVADGAGAFYISDQYNHTIRRMTTGGVVTTVAGLAGAAGFVDATGAAARFYYPAGLSADTAGNLYIADYYNGAIRKMTPAGVVTTVVTQAASGMYNPQAVAVDALGEIYFGNGYSADGSYDARLLKLSAVNGTVTAIGGTALARGALDGTGSNARLQIKAIVADGNGNLYIAEGANNAIRVAKPTPLQDVGTGPASIATGVPAALDTTPVSATSWTWSILRRPAGSSADFSNSTLRNPTFTPDMPDLYVLRVRAQNGANVRYSTVSINATGSCTPALSSVNATLSGASTFCATATGGTASVAVTGGAQATYRWGRRFSTGGLITDIPGANGSSYVLDGADFGGAGPRFLVVTVTPACGAQQVSNEISLSILPAPPAAISAPALVNGFSTGNTASVVDNPGATYVWTITNGTITAGQGTSAITFTAGNVNPITLGITATTSCPRTSSLTVPVVLAPYTFEHFAGTTGGNGRWDGNGSAGRFVGGRNIAIDLNGNFYIPDVYNHVIRTVSPNGEVRTLAGLSGICGAVDATGANARLCYPTAVAVDASGNVFFAMQTVIRKITAAGVVTSLAGVAFNPGSTDGTGTSARFSYDVWGMVVDSGGNLFVTDSGNNLIRKITPAGVVTTIAGTPGPGGSVDGTGPAARFNFPMQMAIDTLGTLYVSDRNNHIIRTVTSGGVVTTIAGVAGSNGYADGPATTTARLNYPEGIAVDAAGALYVADGSNLRIRKIAAGVVSTLAGGATGPTVDGVGTGVRFTYPIGLARDRNGDLYVLDNGYAIRKLDPAGVVTTIAGEVIAWGSADGTGTAAKFAGPAGVAVDAGGNIWMTDYQNNVVRRMTAAGVVTTFVGRTGISGSVDGTGSAARFTAPDGIALDSAGNAYVSTAAHTIRKITPAGVVTTLAGTHGFTGSADGPGTAASFNYPRSMAVDASGNVYVADSANNTIRKITPAGNVTTLAGVPPPAPGGYLDGTGSGARFDRPIGLALDTSGNLLVGDFNNGVIRQVTPAGVVTTVNPLDDYGNPYGGVRADGLAVDASNNLYATDSSSTIIRRITPARVVTVIGSALVNGQAIGAATDGTGTMARFNNNSSITVDPTGETLYLGEFGNTDVRIGKLAHLQDVATANFTSVVAGTSVQLDTTPQTATSWTWSIVRRPAGSAAALSSTSVRNPTFTPDMPDLYTFLVRAAGGGTVRYSTVDVVATGACTPALSGTPVATISGATTFCASSNGGNAAVVGVTGGAFISYRWGWRSISGGAITDIPGATGPTYAVRGADLGGTGNRWLVARVTPACGSSIVTTEIALTVTAAPSTTITAPPIVLANSAGLIASVPDAGGSATYSWTISDGVITSGASTRQITFTAANESPITLNVSVTTGTCTNTGSTTVSVSTLPYTFKMFAGTPGGAGLYDGLPAAARFRLPIAIAIDRNNNTYISDSDNTIRKISATGVVSTLAGLAGSGCALVDGQGPAARFCFADGLAVDSGGNVYVADSYQHAIRKITPAGVVTTLAGNGTAGYVDATGAAARFTYPWGITVDPAGMVFVADYSNCKIRRITPAGVVTTVAGGSCSYLDATGTAARFNGPVDVTNDGAGNLYVADYNNNRIRKITAGGVVTTLAGSSFGFANGTGAAAQFKHPSGVSMDLSGDIIVADSENRVIRRVTAAGVVTTAAGTVGVVGTANGPVASAKFNDPWSVAVDAAGGILVADDYNHDVRRIAGGTVSLYSGTTAVFGSADGTGTAATFYSPFGVTVDSSGNVYVSDTYNSTIRKITAAGVVSTLAGTPSSTGTYADGTGAAAGFNNPRGITVDAAGNLYVADWHNNAIRKITPAGVVTTLAGIAGTAGSADGGPGVATFDQPVGITVDNAGFVYVTDYANATIRKITPAGVVSTLAGWPGIAGSADGIGSAARFNGPHGIVVDAAGYLYVCDAFNNRIRKVSPAGVVTTLTGQIQGWVDGASSTARLYVPTGVAMDALGNLYIADRYNHRIRKVTPDGSVITIAGRNENDNADGTGNIAMVGDPSEIAVGANGLIYIADITFHNIRVGTITTTADSAIVDNPSPSTGTTVNLDATPQTPGTTYTWSIIRRPAGSAADLSSTSVRNPTFTPDFADLYTFLLKAENGGNARYSTVDVTATGACTSLSAVTPSINGPSSVCAIGTAGTASVATTGGAGLSYRWSYRNTHLGADIDIPLANGPTYLISGADFGGTGTKFLVVTVTPTCGSPITSSEMSITVQAGSCSTVPTDVAAVSNAAGTSVHITWTAAVGGTTYDVLRSTDGTNFTPRTTGTAATSFDDATTADTAYLYRIHVTGGGDSANAYAGTFVYTDAPVTSATHIKVVHFTQLQVAANKMLVLAGQPPVSFTALSNTVTVQAAHLTEIRNALISAHSHLGIAAPTFSESIVAGTTAVKTSHIEELRSATH